MIKKIIYIGIAIITVYVLLGNLAHHVLFTEELPDIYNYFEPGAHFSSKWEGVEQTVQ